jgi:hypothetical protein
MTRLAVILGCLVLSASSLQRAQSAETAKAQPVGMSKEQILSCMGPPMQKAAEGIDRGLVLRFGERSDDGLCVRFIQNVSDGHRQFKLCDRSG